MGQFVSYEEYEVLGIRPQEPTLGVDLLVYAT